MSDEDDLLAGEIALGLLDEPEREAAARRLGIDSALAERVDWWRERLEPLSAGDSVEPSEDLWERIEAMLPGNDNAAIIEARRWRAAALAATVVAGLLGTTLLLRPVPVPQGAPPTAGLAPAPVLRASIAGDSGVVATIAYNQTAGDLTIAPGKLDVGKHAAELWIIPADGTPRSLGTIDPAQPATRPARASVRRLIARGSTFAISLEPRGGSPTGLPTGPILGTGKISGS
ncbi:anti-sigma factor domain-containing protein [Novosphingobium sp. NDB2Meth1]|uniref:anti-sigma factor n=1 Tax=Novosphingobium sp. NDB2Meth1 TaxID=1892847 RepID=UPI000931CA8F|nr:anti-sigma factor [Novosphingobium sp. NDB2Meth1]